jgi:hypothetical protein
MQKSPTMKKPFPLCALFFSPLFFIIPSLQAQDSSGTWILSIRKEVTAINAPGVKYRVEEDDSNYVSSEGSEIKKYYAGTVLRKVTLDAFGAMGNTQAELYFSGDQLIFCYESTKLYGGPMSDAHRPLISDEHNRYYLHNGKLIRFVDKKGRKTEGKALLAKQKDVEQLKQVLLVKPN